MHIGYYDMNSVPNNDLNIDLLTVKKLYYISKLIIL